MPTSKPYSRQSTIQLADGTGDSLNRSVPKGTLKGFAVGPASGEGAVRCTVDIIFLNQDFSFTIGTGWARGFNTQSGGGAVIRHLDIDMDADNEIRFFVRNDTGATVNVTASYWGVSKR